MIAMRITIFLFAFALCISNASAQLIHSSVSSKPQAVKPLGPNARIDSASIGSGVQPLTSVIAGSNSTTISASANPASSVASQPGEQAGLVVTNAWPNPLHPASTLHLEVLTDQEGPVTAGIYDLAGTQQGTLELGQMSAGSNELQVAMPDLPSGEYIIRIQQGTDAPEVVRINYIK
jgi:hypothetical protein